MNSESWQRIMKVIEMRKAKELKIGDVVVRSCGQITNLEFLPINEIRFTDRGLVHFIQKSRNWVTLSVQDYVHVVTKEDYDK